MGSLKTPSVAYDSFSSYRKWGIRIYGRDDDGGEEENKEEGNKKDMKKRGRNEKRASGKEEKKRGHEMIRIKRGKEWWLEEKEKRTRMRDDTKRPG